VMSWISSITSPARGPSRTSIRERCRDTPRSKSISSSSQCARSLVSPLLAPPIRARERVVRPLFDEADLDEVARPRLEVSHHAPEMARQLLRTQMEQRVDRRDCTAEGPPQVEIRHVGNRHLSAFAEAPVRELDHPWREIDALRLDAEADERVQH